MKKALILVLGVLLGGVPCCPTQAAQPQYEVDGDRVNLRSAPSLQAEVVSQVSRGDSLTATGVTDGEWVQVAPPASVSFWIYSELVRDGVVAASIALVRAGPGINYKSVARVPKGGRVQVRGSQGEWTKIAPPPGSALWISSTLLKRHVVAPPEPSVASKPVVSPAPSVRPSPTAGARPTLRTQNVPPRGTGAGGVVLRQKRGEQTLPDTLSRDRLVAGQEQGGQVEYAGVLRRAGLVWRRPSQYRLVRTDGRGRTIFTCYVIGPEARLEGVIGRSLIISGREYWVQGVRDPVLVAEQVVASN